MDINDATVPPPVPSGVPSADDRQWGMFAHLSALSGVVKLESVCQAINAKFSGKVAQGNIAGATEAFQTVRARIEAAKKEASHA